MDNSTQETTVPDKERARMSIWSKVMTFVILACIGQLYIFGLIAVIRGYSIRSNVPLYNIFMATIPLIIISLLINLNSSKPNLRKALIVGIPFLLTFTFTYLIRSQQGYHYYSGGGLYIENKYEESIIAYQKEINTWYLRCLYNQHESSALFNIAMAYCQLEKFDQARKTYELITKRFDGYSHDDAINKLNKLDFELKRISKLQKLFSEENDLDKKTSYLFDIATAYKNINCISKAKEQYALIQTLDVHESKKEEARKSSQDL